MSDYRESYWVPRRFKGKSVWVRATEGGEPVVNRGLLDVRYNDKPGAKVYSGSVRNLDAEQAPATAAVKIVDPLASEDGASGSKPKSKSGKKSDAAPPPIPDGAIVVYTDGACSGNPGPAGAGVVILVDGARREFSHYLGEATNNIAELTAIKVALSDLTRTLNGDLQRPIVLHSDSDYAIKVVTGAYRAKKNVALIREIQQLLRPFGKLRFQWVRGHVGVEENERADTLAVSAIERRADTVSE